MLRPELLRQGPGGLAERKRCPMPASTAITWVDLIKETLNPMERVLPSKTGFLAGPPGRMPHGPVGHVLCQPRAWRSACCLRAAQARSIAGLGLRKAAAWLAAYRRSQAASLPAARPEFSLLNPNKGMYGWSRGGAVDATARCLTRRRTPFSHLLKGVRRNESSALSEANP